MTSIPNAARNISTCARPATFFDSARDAFRALLADLPATSNDILLPAFVGQSSREGSGVLDPVRSLKLRPSFYDLNADVTVDVGDFLHQLETVKPIAALVVHYYGRADPNLPALARACQEARVPLIEDAAHGLLSSARAESTVGKYGDATIYSLHKMLPIAYGGMLSIRNPRLSARSTGIHDSLARMILSYDLLGAGEIRRRHFEHYVRAITGSALIGQAYHIPWDTLGADVPQSFPVLLHGVDRDRLYHSLNDDGVGVVSLYHTLVPEAAGRFACADRLAESIINLPLHQDLSSDDIDDAAGAFCAAVSHALSAI